MNPSRLLACTDEGQLWPTNGGDDFTEVAAAYQVALKVRALRLARGDKPVGYKIGFTNRSIWARYQVFAPIWGTVWDRTLSQASDTQALSLARNCQPRIEPEVVFAFKHTPAAACSLAQLFDALDWMAPGFEVVQSHQPDWKFTPAQAVADGALHAQLLVGEPVPLRSVAPDAPALHALLASTQARLFQGKQLVDQGHGALVLDSPLQALLHFLQELRACPGAPDIRAGDVVTTGTWTDAWPVSAGQRWSLEFSALLPALHVTFT